MDKDELTEDELMNVIGSPLSTDKIPNKFKQIKKEEMTSKELENVYGGPIKSNDLDEKYYNNEYETNEKSLK